MKGWKASVFVWGCFGFVWGVISLIVWFFGLYIGFLFLPNTVANPISKFLLMYVGFPSYVVVIITEKISIPSLTKLFYGTLLVGALIGSILGFIIAKWKKI